MRTRDRCGTVALVGRRRHARTAAAYWELAWLGLAEREVRAALLDSADRHLAEALSNTDDTHELHFQRGRVRLLGGHLPAAERSLQRAIVADSGVEWTLVVLHGAAVVVIVPLLLRVAWRDWHLHNATR